MSLKKRLITVGVIAAAAALIFGIAKSGKAITEKVEESLFFIREMARKPFIYGIRTRS